MTHPALPSWISEAVQAEFVNPDLVRDITPTQLAQPGMVTRAVKGQPGLFGCEIGAAFDGELDIDQPARMIHVRLRHQQGEILAFK